jgi:hypothetical protein
MSSVYDSFIVAVNDGQPEEKSREHAVGMAVFQLHSAMEAVAAMSRSDDHLEYLIDQSGRIAEVALASNLLWSQIMKRRAA